MFAPLSMNEKMIRRGNGRREANKERQREKIGIPVERKQKNINRFRLKISILFSPKQAFRGFVLNIN